MRQRQSVEDFKKSWKKTHILLEEAWDDKRAYYIMNCNTDKTLFKLCQPKLKEGYSYGWKWSIVDYSTDPSTIYEDIGTIASALKKLVTLQSFIDISGIC